MVLQRLQQIAPACCTVCCASVAHVLHGLLRVLLRISSFVALLHSLWFATMQHPRARRSLGSLRAKRFQAAGYGGLVLTYFHSDFRY